MGAPAAQASVSVTFVVFVGVAVAFLVGLLVVGLRRPRLAACIAAAGAFVLGLGGLISPKQGGDRCGLETDYGGIRSKPSLFPPGTICEAEPESGRPVGRSTLLALPVGAYVFLAFFSSLSGLAAFGFLVMTRGAWRQRRRRPPRAKPG